ncbi:tail fiber domain-containing protein [Portibacter lacus]|uniref:Peptidase S74 domain-containing protein n=1 Tax=Portibacter lacus TaxID=1099794 RepID=A0AA37SPF1_9BACT|nr:tail fiber domain-containing protein [Portibacter lacus]GLR17657.1 hypothetical protein GCM10007940_22720 [Portibacter lacus]
MQLATPSESHFLRLFSGSDTNFNPYIYWNQNNKLVFGRTTSDFSNISAFLSLDGKTIEVLNTGSSVFLGEGAGSNDDGNSRNNTSVGHFSLHNNVDGNNNTAIGVRAGLGSTNSSSSGNVFIGYQAGDSELGNNKLYIENSSHPDPLIYGEFDNKLLRIYGIQENFGGLDINKGISSGVALSINGDEALWSDGNYFSYGFGSTHNYFGRPVRIGKVEGSSFALADLHVVDNTGIANIMIESYIQDAIIQLAGNTNNATAHWTIRRRNSDGHLQWKHNDLNRMLLTQDGNLGINTLTPDQTIHVNGTSKVSTNLPGTGNFVSTIENLATADNNRYNGLLIRAGVPGANSNNISELLRFESPDNAILGRIQQTSSNSVFFSTTSDRRLKKEIMNTNYGIDELMKITVRDYYWKSDTNNSKLQTGFIAQELYEVFPNAAYQGGENANTDPWGVRNDALIPLLVKGIQEQQDIIQSQNKEISDLKQMVIALKNLVEDDLRSRGDVNPSSN